MIVELACTMMLLVGAPAPAQMPEIDAGQQAAEQPKPAKKQPKAVPKIHTPTPAVDLGKIMQGETASGTFVIENKGDADLEIQRVRASCGCTTVKLTKDQKTIPPGGKVELSAKFNSRGRQGQQKNYVSVMSNDPKTKNLRLTLKAFIETLIKVKPSPILKIRNARPGQKITQHLDLIPGAGEKSLELTSVKFSRGGMNFTQEPVTEGDKTGVRLHFTVDEAASIGTLHSMATVEAKVGDRTAQQTIRITGKVVGDLSFIPPTVQVTRPTVRGQPLSAVSVKADDRKPFKILSAQAGSYLHVKVKNRRAQLDHEVALTLSESAPDGPFGTFLDIRTTKVSQPVIRIPVFGNVAPRVSAFPPAVLLKANASPEATVRRVLLSTPRGAPLTVTGATSDNPFVIAEVLADASAAKKGRKAVEITLNPDVPPGTHEAVVTITTNVKGAGEIRVPVTIINHLEEEKGEEEKAAAAAQ